MKSSTCLFTSIFLNYQVVPVHTPTRDLGEGPSHCVCVCVCVCVYVCVFV